MTDERTIRLASIVAIDVVGFSTMSERDQRATARKIENLRARIDQCATANGGRLFNTAGDGFMLEFSSAGSALGAIQDILDKRAKGEPKIRVGAHVGDVVVTATNDLLGHGVNVAARLQALAEPGTALVSAEFRSMARSSPTAAFQSKGRQPLDNIEQKVQTFEILSKRQKFARSARRFGWGVGAVAALAVVIFFAPMGIRLAQESFNLRQASATQATATTAQPEPVYEQAASTPETPQFTPGQTFRDCATCPEMVVLPGGLFTMGSPAAEAGRGRDEGPQREVSIGAFAISKYEVTFSQWDACLAASACNGFSPADFGWGRGDRPVVGVSWEDAQAYLDWLNSQAGGLHYRLVTEAEWEYAARAGGATPYPTGNRISAQQATFQRARTTPVGDHDANAFGVYDLTGNVSEWVEDCYVANYQSAPIDGAAVQPDVCTRRVYRGGSFADRVQGMRVALRHAASPSQRPAGVGFRVARTLN
ncbi:SUMF1/EgtB/PvdO family nonheme iron enzyme [Terricaulis sp.]|uniref:SUMF1/EgtB/PvdO family nonheme iron enzyme n=1 Tax=Terricaulis sp. TaxID=2768686 RepID=UPI0037844CBA